MITLMQRQLQPTKIAAFFIAFALVLGISLNFAEEPSSFAGSGEAVEAEAPLPAPQPADRHLILLPGGGFMTFDSGFKGRMVPAAMAAGFVPHYFEYPLDDLPGAIAAVRALAERLAADHGRENVFAFGSSAGGTLATYLAGEARVAAAVSSSGLYDFRDWPWVSLFRDPDFFSRIKLSTNERRDLSPVRRPLHCPLLAIHGTRDPIVSYFQATDYVALKRRATLHRTDAGHGAYRSRPQAVRFGMRWLHWVGRAQARADRRLAALERARLRRQLRGDRLGALRLVNRRMREYQVAQVKNTCARPPSLVG